MVKEQNLLTEVESKELLKKAGIPVVEATLARSKKEAVSISKEVGFPVVLKISSPDVIHKSDSGGVRLGLANATQVGKAYSEIVASIRKAFPKAVIDGVSVQKMAPPGVEVIVGVFVGVLVTVGDGVMVTVGVLVAKRVILKLPPFRNSTMVMIPPMTSTAAISQNKTGLLRPRRLR